MRIAVVVTTVLAACALVAGCGGSESAPVVSGEPIALEDLSRSASTSSEASSGRFAFDLALRLPGAAEPMSFSGEGAFDRADERASFAVDMSGFAQLLGGFLSAFGGSVDADAPDFEDPSLWQIEVVEDGGVSYVNLPAVGEKLPEGKSWVRSDGGRVKVDGSEFGELEDVATSDPREFLGVLDAAGGDVEVVGTEQLRGVAVTHYRATVDLAKAVKKRTADLGPLAEPLQAGVGEVPLDIWLDGDGLVRKLSFDISAAEQAQSGSASMTFEFWDYGEDVRIDLPPADEVVDASALRS